jgi:hypothetical protein
MLLGMGDITALANAIQTMEGYYPGSLAYTNNNPGNLVYAGQAGATKSCSKNGYCYAAFPTYDDGYQALLNQIQGQAAQGQTLQQFIWQYAPPCPKAGQIPDPVTGLCPDGTKGNDTSTYLTSLENATGASASTPLTNVISGDMLTSSDAGGSDSTTGISTDSSSFDLSSLDPTGIISAAMGGDPTSIAILGGVAALGLWLLIGRKS